MCSAAGPLTRRVPRLHSQALAGQDANRHVMGFCVRNFAGIARMSPMTDESKPRWTRRRVIILAIKLLLLGVVLWLVGRAMFGAIGDVKLSDLKFRPLWLVVGAVTIWMGVLSAAWVFKKFYGRMGTPLTLRQGTALLTLPMLGAYVPGRALAMAGHVGIARKMGVPLAVATTGMVLQLGLGLLAAMLLGLGALLIQPLDNLPKIYVQAPIGIVLVLTLVAMHPKLYFGLINYILHRMKQETVDVHLPFGFMLKLLIGMGGYVVCFVLGHVALVAGVMDLPAAKLPMIFGAVTMATTIGLVSVFTAAGGGVREGLLMGFLDKLLGTGGALLFAAALRVLQILADILLATTGFLVYRGLPRNEAED